MYRTHAYLIAALLLPLPLSGCGSEDPPPVSNSPPEFAVQPKQKPSAHPPIRVEKKKANTPPAKQPPRKDVTFEKELKEAGKKNRKPLPRPKPVDESALQAAGFHKLTGERLTLYTDVPLDPTIKELPAVFDQAFGPWCEYFGVKDQDPPWHLRGFLMRDERSRERLRRMGLVHPAAKDFGSGYAANYEFWFFEQKSPYYRRHLMLHEGTHGFMQTAVGPCQSAWYAEATAELFGTHLWEKNKLTMRHFPRNRKEVPYHGRIKLVKEAFVAANAAAIDRIVGQAFSPHDPSALSPDDEPDPKAATRGYAWCWATAAFLDGHPKYQIAFRKLHEQMHLPGMTGAFRKSYESDWDNLLEEWQVFVAGLEYGYDVRRGAIEFKPGEPLPADGATATIRADAGWQSSGLRAEAGKTYDLTASGRYTVAQQPKPWPCEPGGITIRYYHGLPLGMLLGAVRIDAAQRQRLRETNPQALNISPFLRPTLVGLGTKIKPQFSGTLYFKINDSAAELADNAGTLQIRVAAE